MRTTPRKPSRSNVYGLFGLLLIAFAVACDESKLQAPPPEILGAWETSAERYRDRTFEIRDDALVFGTGRYAPSRLHILIGVEPATPTAHWNVYRFHYREYDGEIGEIEIHHHAGAHPKLRFANRPEVWTRRVERESDDV